jgi:hypothetical protein
MNQGYYNALTERGLDVIFYGISILRFDALLERLVPSTSTRNIPFLSRSSSFLADGIVYSFERPSGCRLSVKFAGVY